MLCRGARTGVCGRVCGGEGRGRGRRCGLPSHSRSVTSACCRLHDGAAAARYGDAGSVFHPLTCCPPPRLVSAVDGAAVDEGRELPAACRLHTHTPTPTSIPTAHQSTVQQLTSDGNCRSRSLNALPMGLKHSMTCRFSRVWSTKKFHSSTADSSTRPLAFAVPRHCSSTAARSS
eukprot:314360-Chlamydomonas_euryale.AAC.1